MKTAIETNRVWGAVLAIALVATVLGQMTAPASASGQDTSQVQIDLAAIALTPVDLAAEGLTGYGGGVSVHADAETAADFLAHWRQDPDRELTSAFRAANPLRVYILFMGLPLRADEPQSLTLRAVFSYVFEFPDEVAAAAGFDLLSEGWLTGSATAEPTTSRVGDDRRLFREEGLDPGTGNPYQRADLLFTYDRLVAGVSSQDAGGVAPIETELEALAMRQAARADIGLQSEATGLSNQVVRLAAPNGIDPWDADRYGAVNGTVLKQRNHTAEQHAERQTLHDKFGIIDYYFVNQILGNLTTAAGITYANGLRSFESERGADAFQLDAIDRLVERRPINFAKMPDPPRLGDGTIVHSYEVESDGRVQAFWRVDIRVGTTMSTLFLFGPTLPPWDAVKAIAMAQADCLVRSACLDPISLPELFGASAAAQAPKPPPCIPWCGAFAAADPARMPGAAADDPDDPDGGGGGAGGDAG